MDTSILVAMLFTATAILIAAVLLTVHAMHRTHPQRHYSVVHGRPDILAGETLAFPEGTQVADTRQRYVFTVVHQQAHRKTRLNHGDTVEFQGQVGMYMSRHGLEWPEATLFTLTDATSRMRMTLHGTRYAIEDSGWVRVWVERVEVTWPRGLWIVDGVNNTLVLTYNTVAHTVTLPAGRYTSAETVAGVVQTALRTVPALATMTAVATAGTDVLTLSGDATFSIDVANGWAALGQTMSATLALTFAGSPLALDDFATWDNTDTLSGSAGVWVPEVDSTLRLYQDKWYAANQFNHLPVDQLHVGDLQTAVDPQAYELEFTHTSAPDPVKQSFSFKKYTTAVDAVTATTLNVADLRALLPDTAPALLRRHTTLRFPVDANILLTPAPTLV
jgi:hypothetical protein